MQGVPRARAAKSPYQNRGTELAGLVGMSKPLVPDELWDTIAPLLPPEPPKPKGGRPRVPNRACLTGIVFVLKTGLPWESLPQELGCGSGMTCWRRLRDWQADGVWEQLHRALPDRLGEADQIDWERACLDSASVPAKKGAARPGRTRRIAANRARSAMLWSTGMAPRSRSA
jgi:transposase